MLTTNGGKSSNKKDGSTTNIVRTTSKEDKVSGQQTESPSRKRKMPSGDDTNNEIVHPNKKTRLLNNNSSIESNETTMRNALIAADVKNSSSNGNSTGGNGNGNGNDNGSGNSNGNGNSNNNSNSNGSITEISKESKENTSEQEKKENDHKNDSNQLRKEKSMIDIEIESPKKTGIETKVGGIETEFTDLLYTHNDNRYNINHHNRNYNSNNNLMLSFDLSLVQPYVDQFKTHVLQVDIPEDMTELRQFTHNLKKSCTEHIQMLSELYSCIMELQNKMTRVQDISNEMQQQIKQMKSAEKLQKGQVEVLTQINAQLLCSLTKKDQQMDSIMNWIQQYSILTTYPVKLKQWQDDNKDFETQLANMINKVDSSISGFDLPNPNITTTTTVPEVNKKNIPINMNMKYDLQSLSFKNDDHQINYKDLYLKSLTTLICAIYNTDFDVTFNHLQGQSDRCSQCHDKVCEDLHNTFAQMNKIATLLKIPPRESSSSFNEYVTIIYDALVKMVNNNNLHKTYHSLKSDYEKKYNNSSSNTLSTALSMPTTTNTTASTMNKSEVQRENGNLNHNAHSKGVINFMQSKLNCNLCNTAIPLFNCNTTNQDTNVTVSTMLSNAVNSNALASNNLNSTSNTNSSLVDALYASSNKASNNIAKPSTLNHPPLMTARQSSIPVRAVSASVLVAAAAAAAAASGNKDNLPNNQYLGLKNACGLTSSNEFKKI